MGKYNNHKCIDREFHVHVEVTLKTAAAATFVSGILLVLGGPRSDDHVASSSRAGVRAAAPLPPSADVVSPVGHARWEPALAAEALTPVVQRYCVVCHNDQLMTGNLTLQAFDVAAAPERAEDAEKMIVKLRVGMMPPPGAPRPGGDTLLMLVETLEDELDRFARENPNPGTRRSQRMNRSEYEHVIRDLLGLEIEAENWLAPDSYLGSFDNAAAVQEVTSTSLEAYMRAASEVSRLAVGTAAPAADLARYTVPQGVSQHPWERVEGAPYGSRGGMVVTHDFLADGLYIFSANIGFGRGIRGEDMDISVAGEPLATIPIQHDRRLQGGGDNPLETRALPIRTDPVFVRAGQHKVAVTFVRRMDGPYDYLLEPPDLSSQPDGADDYGQITPPHLSGFSIVGPVNPVGISETESRKRIFTCSPSDPAEQRSCAESILSRLASRAYRRPATAEDMAGLMSFYEDGSAEGGFEEGVRLALQAILSSPSFVFRHEFEPESVSPGEIFRLDDLALASRLAFFLWNTIPDGELLSIAQEGLLSDERVLEEQVRRMLADPRSEVLATRFAAQWLRLQDLEQMKPEPYFFPDYTRQLAESMRRETELFFDHLVREDRSFLELFTADYTFVDEYLAKHYGIGFSGPAGFRRVQYPDADRRGILGHAGVLTLTSLANRTSPVLRGKWVMEVLMGSPPPPPPPNVPALDETAAERGNRILTTRERMELHRANPVCSACHRFIDPIGLALDNFDVTGKWRIRENGAPLDTRGTFYDGTPISELAELRDALLKRPIPLARTFTQNMLAYATGRSITYVDAPAIRAITRQAEENDYRMSSFILGIVKSDAFRMKRAEVMSDAGP